MSQWRQHHPQTWTTSQGSAPSVDRSFGIGILGYAPSVGKLHGLAAERKPGLYLAAACDFNPGQLAQASVDFPRITAYTDAAGMARDPDIDLVIVATVPNSHASLTIEIHRLRQGYGGGALLDVGCYGVSAARLFLSAEPVAVQAQAIYGAGNGVDIHLIGNLRFANDTLATIEASFCSGLQQTYSIAGSGGVIDLPQDAFIPWEKDAVIYYRGAGAETGDALVVPGVDEYRLMVEHFGDQVLKGVDSLVPVGESMRNLLVLDALARAAQTGGSVAPERKIALAP